jgi:hypothetical protein
MYKMILLLLLLVSCSGGGVSEEKQSSSNNNNNNSGNNSGGGNTDNISSLQVALSTTKTPRMADRLYIGTKLRTIFGPDANWIIFENITRRMDSFGAPCDIYENSRNGAWGSLDFPDSECFSAQWNSPHNSPSTTLRQGYLTKACEQMVSYAPQTLDYALSSIGLNDSAAINSTNVEKAYQLFYGEENLPTNVLQALGDIGAHTISNREHWQAIFLTLCLSPSWSVY